MKGYPKGFDPSESQQGFSMASGQASSYEFQTLEILNKAFTADITHRSLGSTTANSVEKLNFDFQEKQKIYLEREFRLKRGTVICFRSTKVWWSWSTGVFRSCTLHLFHALLAYGLYVEGGWYASAPLSISTEDYDVENVRGSRLKYLTVHIPVECFVLRCVFRLQQ